MPGAGTTWHRDHSARHRKARRLVLHRAGAPSRPAVSTSLCAFARCRKRSMPWRASRAWKRSRDDMSSFRNFVRNGTISGEL